MKKLTVSVFCLMFVLAGCGTTDNRDNMSSAPVPDIKSEESTESSTETEVTESPVTDVLEPEVTDAVTTEVTTEIQGTTTVYVAVPKETTAQTTTETAELPTQEIITSPVREPDTVKPDRETVIESYKRVLRTRIEKVMNEGAVTPLVSYALYDMDYDGTPELLVKYGSCEADFRIAIFKYQSDGMITLADDMGGSHTSFGYDYVANQVVLINGHMGGGNMTWYDIDENGQLRCLIDTGGFAYNDGDDFDAIMERYHVMWLDFSEFYGSDTTWVSTYTDGELNMEEYGGYDFGYLENYVF